MKKLVIITIALSVLMFIVTAVFTHFMPDPIPIHFNIEGVADGFGSPLTYFITPAVSVFVACIILVGTAVSNARGLEKDYLALSYITVGTLILLNIINVCLCTNAFIYGRPDAYVKPSFLIRIIIVAIGIYQLFFSQWITMIPHHASSIKKFFTEEEYNNSMQFVKKSGMLLGGSVALTALFVPLIPEVVVIVTLYLIWSVLTCIKLKGHSIQAVKLTDASENVANASEQKD